MGSQIGISEGSYYSISFRGVKMDPRKCDRESGIFRCYQQAFFVHTWPGPWEFLSIFSSVLQCQAADTTAETWHSEPSPASCDIRFISQIVHRDASQEGGISDLSGEVSLTSSASENSSRCSAERVVPISLPCNVSDRIAGITRQISSHSLT